MLRVNGKQPSCTFRITKKGRDLFLPMEWTTLTNPVTCCGPSEELMDGSCLSIRGLVITLTWRLQSSSNISLMLFPSIGNGR